MKYAVITFGCRVNQADSLGFEEQLRAGGAIASPPESADVVVVNTCSVTATSDQGARQTIRRVARDNPNAKIIVTGCYATRRPDEVAVLPNVVRVVGNDDKPRLIRLIAPDVSTAERFGRAMAPAARQSNPAWPGEQPTRYAFKPDVRSRAPTASFLRRVACREACHPTTW